MCFFLGMSPGFWSSALTNILHAKGLDAWITPAFLVAPCAALVSPLIIGAMADQRIRGERLLGWIAIVGAVLLFAAFRALDLGWNPWWFVGFFALHSIFTGPMWGLGTMIALTHLENGERQFPLVRMGGTIGWMAAGLITSHVLHADRSVACGYASVIARLVLAGVAFAMPATPSVSSSRSWKSALGVEAFSLLRDRDHFVFFFVTGLLSVPMSAFYMYVPRHLEALGDDHASATMTLGQWSEIAAMILVSALMVRCRVKVLLVWALSLTVTRFACFALGGMTGLKSWVIAGISLHGIAYTFYFITAQIFLDRRVPRGMRGQAQGLVTLVSAGIGSGVGTVFSGWFYQTTVLGGHGGWTLFWAVMTGIMAVCLVMFAMLYRGLATGSDPS